MDRHASTRFEQPMQLPYTDVDAMLQFNALGRRIVYREPEDALREGFVLVWEGLDPAVEGKVSRWLRRRYHVVQLLKRARAFARAYGGSVVIAVADDGRRSDEPLDLVNLRRVPKLFVRDRWEVQPAEQLDLDPASHTYGEPEHYLLVNSPRNYRIHASRVIRFDGFDLPDRIRERQHGWGGSVFDLVFAELRNLGASMEDAAEAITLLTQGIFKIDGLLAAMDRTGGEELIARRYRALRLGLGTLGDIVIDKQREEYALEGRTFAGIGEILDILRSAIVAATDMPRVILMGETPAGLNNGANAGEVRAWYDFVGAQRSDIYEDALLRLLEILLSAADSPTGGVVPFDLGVDWPKLWQLTEGEAATVRLTHAQARATDKSAGMLSDEELRTDNDLAEHYDLERSEDGVVTSVDREQSDAAETAEAAEAEPTVVQDESTIPTDEVLVSALSAAQRMGGRSAGPIIAMIREGKIRGWRRSPGSPWRVLMSEVMRAQHHQAATPAVVSAEPSAAA
ncbi:MAG: DUF1073 domain-containing protein [Myxococcales bacterium]|nr:DUF1073 domain-containing protein [Myxococcales bacterium]